MIFGIIATYRRKVATAIDLYRSKGAVPLLVVVLSHVGSLLVNLYAEAVQRLFPHTGPSTINGVAMPMEARHPHVKYDRFLPLYPPTARFYWSEEAVVTAHGLFTEHDDDIVIVGGGVGVTTVHASEQSETGSVTVYEAGETHAALTEKTLELNQVPTEWVVHQAAVGPAHELYGYETPTSVDQVETTDLPDCDVLELDCEGSELSILQELGIRPRVIIVEIHPYKGDFEPTAVLDELDRLEYHIERRYTHQGAELTQAQLLETLHARVKTEGEGLPPVVVAFRTE